VNQTIRLVLALVSLVSLNANISGCTSTALADTDKTVRAPEVYLIGEASSYVEDGVTVTVEPGVLVLYN
jgi:hypothetical protein